MSAFNHRQFPIGRMLWLVALGLMISSAGCGKKDRVTRLPLFGKVSTSNDEEINGSITFIPSEGFHGPAATATIANGEYQFNQENGPTAGPHQVIVKRLTSRNRLPGTNRGDQKSDSEAIPSGNSKTEWRLSANLTKNASNQYDFTLPP